jgi:hypothetical protein
LLTLSDSKLLYSEMEKMAYVVVMAARKLRCYFHSYRITVPASYTFETCLKIERPPEELANGQPNSQNTQSTSSLATQSSLRS